MSNNKANYLRIPFTSKVHLSELAFFPEEIWLLTQYGSWYEALHEGRVAAASAAQFHFVACSRNEVEPISRHEVVWKKYLRSLEGAVAIPEEQPRPSPQTDLKEPRPQPYDPTDRQTVIPQWGRPLGEFRKDYYEEIIYPYCDDGT